jgi:hypothetical protein
LGGGGSIWNVFGRMGNITAQTGDYTAAQVTNAVDASGTYSNPAWLTALGYTAAATGLCPAGFVTATTASGVTCSVPAATSYALKFDGSSTSLADGSTVTWSCGSGAGAQCTTTYTVPAGMNWVTVQAWSGGAGGDGSSQGSATDGGGGGYFTGKCAVTPGGTVSVAVGLGGPHGYHQGTTTSGGGTSFGTCFTLLGARHAWTGDAVGGYLSGGLPGTSGWQSTYGALTGNCTPSGTVGYSALRPDGGGCGGGATVSSGAVGAAGGYANYGGGGGGAGGFNSNTGGVGGTSGIGGAGGNGGGWTSGTGVIACTAGSISGGGGGGAGVETAGGSNLNGCDGARGEVRVYYTR